LIKKLEAGLNIALVSDAGTPLVSDPGFHIVREAIDKQIPVIPIPGPSAAISAMSVSGLPAREFTFVGFLPPKSGARRAQLKALSTIATTLVLYEAPHRIQETVKDALEILGDRECVLAREITKLHEEFVRGRLSEIKARNNVRGELVLLIGPSNQYQDRQPMHDALPSITKDVERLMHADEIDQKTALKRIARERGISKSDAYRQMIAERDQQK
jgi:16S rRNA (cytidine1402-2'-O)-methyltransferase